MSANSESTFFGLVCKRNMRDVSEGDGRGKDALIKLLFDVAERDKTENSACEPLLQNNFTCNIIKY